MELEFKRQEWDMRTLPNKMYELVHNTGDINKKGTGYLTDAESEMITILNYLNFGEKTGITESMIAQIDQAIRDSESGALNEDEYANGTLSEDASGLDTDEFVEQMLVNAKTPIAVIYYYKTGKDAGYSVVTHKTNGESKKFHFETLVDSRRFLSTMGYNVRMQSPAREMTVVETWI